MSTSRDQAAYNRQWAASKRASTFSSGRPIGRAQVGLSNEEMVLLRDVMLLVPLYKEKKIGKAEFESLRSQYIGQLNNLDRTLLTRWQPSQANRSRGFNGQAPTVRSWRPMAYVPYWDGRKLKLPNEFVINNRLRKSYNKASGHKLMAVLGAQHLAMMGFATRPRDSTGAMSFSVGNIRPYAKRVRTGPVVNTKTFGWYRSASGSMVSITARSKSRLAQLVFNTGGGVNGLPAFVPNGRFQPYTDKSGSTISSPGQFLSPDPGARGLGQGEFVRRVAGRDGVARYVIGGAPASRASGARGYGGSDVFKSATQITSNANARAKAGGGRVRFDATGVPVPPPVRRFAGPRNVRAPIRDFAQIAPLLESGLSPSPGGGEESTDAEFGSPGAANDADAALFARQQAMRRAALRGR